MLYSGCLIALERSLSVCGDNTGSRETLQPSPKDVGHVTTAADDQCMLVQHICNRRLTAEETGRQPCIHPQSVRNRLNRKFGQILTQRHRATRRDWCSSHLLFRRADWLLVSFSDECRLNLSHADGSERVYRRRRECYVDACIIERRFSLRLGLDYKW